jgi:hypothetical protein
VHTAATKTADAINHVRFPAGIAISRSRNADAIAFAFPNGPSAALMLVCSVF